MSAALTISQPYVPRTDLLSKLRRRSARIMARDIIRPKLDRGIVSLSFDDCPVSVRDTALPMIEAQGWRATIYASFGLSDTVNHLGAHMQPEDYVAAHTRGHEIGDHTFSHMDGLAEGVDAIRKDIAKNRKAMKAAGLPPATTFAFPYGEVTPSLKRALREEFGLLRGVHAPSDATLDLSLAASQRVYRDTMKAALAAVKRAALRREWLILFTHDVREDCSDFGCTPDQFANLIATIKDADVDVLPVAQALERIV